MNSIAYMWHHFVTWAKKPRQRIQTEPLGFTKDWLISTKCTKCKPWRNNLSDTYPTTSISFQYGTLHDMWWVGKTDTSCHLRFIFFRMQQNIKIMKRRFILFIYLSFDINDLMKITVVKRIKINHYHIKQSLILKMRKSCTVRYWLIRLWYRS